MDLCRLIGTFVFCYLQSLISKLTSFTIPIVQLVSLAEHIIFRADPICISMKLSYVQDISGLVGGLEPICMDKTLGYDEDFIRFW